LYLKGLKFDAIPVHLLRDGGEQHMPAYERRNPARLVPLFEGGTFRLTQSLAIIEYLEELHPTPALLPSEPEARAQVRAFALGIACDIHPLNNLRVQRYLETALGIDEQRRQSWSRHWVAQGFTAIERTLAESASTGLCCYGDVPTLADCCLIPQVFNARRLDCPLGQFPTIVRIYEHCMKLAAFQRGAPQAQSDAE
jgi:maleylacetoacetate isomerase